MRAATSHTKVLTLAALACLVAAVVATSAFAGTRGCGVAGGYSVSANSNTSCSFARNVARAFSRGSSYPQAYSPATGRYYTMHCRRAGSYSYTCVGGSNAYVRLRG